MILNNTEFLLSLSFALDFVESEVLGVLRNHSKRASYIASRIASQIGMNTEEIIDLISYTVMHDNGLTEYILEKNKNAGKVCSALQAEYSAAEHCTIGERNIIHFPLFHYTPNVIAYHHEHIDGSGFFGKSGSDIPLEAKIIRIADAIDTEFNLSNISPEKHESIIAHIHKHSGTRYDADIAHLIPDILDEQAISALSNANIDVTLKQSVPSQIRTIDDERMIEAAQLFSHIIDYKSPFTYRHSSEIANKTHIMAHFYDCDPLMQTELYIAALLHDVGKLAVPSAYLEKPSGLTPNEYTEIKKHVQYTYEILHNIGGFERICEWASNHHEKCDGSGYFRSLNTQTLDFNSQLLACIDIYQALIEARPYRQPLSHNQAIDILQSCVNKGQLNAQIVSDIELVLGK